MKLRIAAVIFLFIALVFILLGTISQEGPGWKSAKQSINLNKSLTLPTKLGIIILPASLMSYKAPLKTMTISPTTTTTTTTTTVSPSTTIVSSPTTSTATPYVTPTTQVEVASSPNIVQSGNDSTNAFTSNWYRCVIIPESGGNFSVTSGGYGILVSTWHSYGMSGVPGDYSPEAQATVALQIFASNGGFGPGAWNNPVGCGKAG